MSNQSYPTGETFAYSNSGLVRASKANPCPHCGKPDWCYNIGELSVCNRDQPPAAGWETTSKTDKEGHYFYARPQEKKPVRPRQTRHWRYDTRDGSTLIRVVRVDDGEGGKKIWQEHWDGSEWQKGLGDVARQDIPIFAYYDIRKAIKDGQPIFIVEGEACADALWDLGIAATTNIGGSGKWQDIAESSQMKTPVMNDMIVDPLASMRVKNKRVFDAQQRVHAEALQAWKNSDEPDKGLAPEPPVQINPYITKATWEAVAGMVGRSPDQGILWISDELAGFFNSANQYRGGRGSDKEDLLEAWSGNGAVVARAAGTVVDVGAMSLSIYGNIQPKVLAPLLGDGEDNNGTFARFDFVQQPLAASQIVLGLPKIDINPMLEALYAKADAMPVRHFELDLEAKKTFVDYYNRCQQLRIRSGRK